MDKVRRTVRSRPEPRDDVIHLAIRLGLLAFLVYWSFVLVRPFIAILVWSMVLTVALYPAYDWLARKLGGRYGLAAVLLTLLSLVIVIGPATWFGVGLVDAARTISEQLSSASFAVPEPPPGIKEWPIVGGRIYEFWNLASTNLASALATIGPQVRPLAKPVLEMAGSAGEGILEFLLALVLMGFLFGSGPRMAHNVRMLLMHVVPERSEEFIALAGATIRTVSQGVLGVAVLQAMLAGIGFGVAGVPGGSILTFLVLLMAIVQVGASLVILGVLVWAWMTMDTMGALLLTAYLVPVSLVDNVLKPLLMSHGLQTPMLVIFIGVLGGTLAHGVVGLFVGPIVLAVAWQLMRAWMRDTTSDDGLGVGSEPAARPSKDRKIS